MVPRLRGTPQAGIALVAIRRALLTQVNAGTDEARDNRIKGGQGSGTTTVADVLPPIAIVGR